MIIIHFFFLFLLSTFYQPPPEYILLDRIEDDLFIAFDTSEINGVLLQWVLDSEDHFTDKKSFKKINTYPELLSYTMGGYGPNLNNQNFIPLSLSQFEELDCEYRIKVFRRINESTKLGIIATMDIFHNNEKNTQLGSACYGVVEYHEYIFNTSIEEGKERFVVCLNIKIPTRYGVANITISRIFSNRSNSEIINWGENMLDRIRII